MWDKIKSLFKFKKKYYYYFVSYVFQGPVGIGYGNVTFGHRIKLVNNDDILKIIVHLNKDKENVDKITLTCVSLLDIRRE